MTADLSYIRNTILLKANKDFVNQWFKNRIEIELLKQYNNFIEHHFIHRFEEKTGMTLLSALDVLEQTSGKHIKQTRYKCDICNYTMYIEFIFSDEKNDFYIDICYKCKQAQRIRQCCRNCSQKTCEDRILNYEFKECCTREVIIPDESVCPNCNTYEYILTKSTGGMFTAIFCTKCCSSFKI